jgi:hypothetical protein
MNREVNLTKRVQTPAWMALLHRNPLRERRVKPDLGLQSETRLSRRSESCRRAREAGQRELLAAEVQSDICHVVIVGVDLRTVQQWLGHSDMESTMRYLKPSRSQQVREKVNEIFA